MTTQKKQPQGYLINADIQFQNGFLAHQKGLLPVAQDWYRRALQSNPKHPAALHMLGILYAQWGHHEDAVKFIAMAAELSPADFSILNNLGNALIKIKRFPAALKALDQALKINPDSAEVWNNRGNALFGLASYSESLDCYTQSLRLRPEYAEALCNMANVQIKQFKFSQALETVERALLIDPSMPVTHNTKGHVLYALNKLENALNCFDESLLLRPNYGLSFYGRGLCFVKLNRTADAIHEFELALVNDPSLVEVYPELATALFSAKRYEEALKVNDKAIALNSTQTNLLGARTLLKTRICQWSDLGTQLNEIYSRINQRQMVALPFHLLSVTDNLYLHQLASEIFTRNQFTTNQEVILFSKKAKKSKKYRIKIGYYSSDFHDHATMRLMAEFFELHDRTRFEVFGFSFGPITNDIMQKRAVAAFDQFIGVNDLSDTEVADLSRQMGIDIAVDLKGLTGDCRFGIFAARAAPIQVNYLGYPGTIGADYIDYIISDPVLIPDNLRHFYTEKVVQLPHTYQVNDRKRFFPATKLSKSTYGLPANSFVFCCCNNNYKITQEMFSVWMQILHHVPGSVLWLLSDNQKAEENLKKEASVHDISPDRLVFAPRVNYEENLSRQPHADLFLDTFPYNAHTTASDALWSGLPVLTMQGQSFAARVGASLLHAVGLPELVTTTEKDYEQLAVSLALAPKRMHALKTKLLEARTVAPLFNTPLLTGDIENAYRAMFDRHLAGLPPDHLVL